jgi:hypothetical protein
MTLEENEKDAPVESNTAEIAELASRHVEEAHPANAQNGVQTPTPQYETPQTDGGGTGVIAIGVILDIIGVILLVYGYHKSNDLASQFESVMMTGSYSNGSTIMIVGVVLIVIGGILDFVGAAMKRG